MAVDPRSRTRARTKRTKKSRILELLDEGLPPVEIAKQVDTHHQYVRNIKSERKKRRQRQQHRDSSAHLRTYRAAFAQYNALFERVAERLAEAGKIDAREWNDVLREALDFDLVDEALHLLQEDEPGEAAS